MKSLENLLRKNREWAARIKRDDPEFFKSLGEHQSPEYLWIGCSDSRVPASDIVGLKPGELFVHRNIANVVVLADMNCISVIEYAVQVLKVKHVIVCGHYGCGGIKAAMDKIEVGLTNNWLKHINEVEDRHKVDLKAIEDREERFRLLCELNVLEQVRTVSITTAVRMAWTAGQDLTIHGWIYDIQDGLIKDLHLKASNAEEAIAMRKMDKARFRSRPD